MANAFKDKRSILWIGGVAVLILGVLAAFVVLPSRAKDVSGPDIHVPAMQNVPPASAPKMHLDGDQR